MTLARSAAWNETAATFREVLPHYGGTLLRFALLAAATTLAMVLLYRLLRRFRCRDGTAAGYAFILPWLLGILAFWVAPFGMSLYFSLTRYSVVAPAEWVGIQNYIDIFTKDAAFRDAVENTVTFALFSVALGIFSSLVAALLLSLDAKLMGLWRTVYYLPSVLPAVSTALLWRWIFVPDPDKGLLNGLLHGIGFSTDWLPGWFNDPDWVIPAFVIMSLQGAAGNNMVIFLAKIKDIDAQLFEAATIDGAGLWARFRHITIPQISPVIFYHIVMGIIGSLQLFTQPMFVATPGRSGLFYVPYIYRKGWEELRMGYACALSWVLFIALLVLTALVFRSSRYWVSYEQSDIGSKGDSRVVRPDGGKLLLWYTAVTLGGFIMLVPILWMISTSLKSKEAILTPPLEWIDLPLRFANYAEAWVALPFSVFVVTTLFITILATAAQVLSSLLVAYGFARFEFPGRRWLYGLLVSTMLIPGMVLIVPVFLIWAGLGLTGEFDPLVLGAVFGGSALFVFIAYQFLRTLPKELEEASRIDGASHARTFFSVVLPLSKPVMLVIALIAFQSHWNDFLGPLLYLYDRSMYTMTLGLHFFQASFMSGEAPQWHWMMAMTTVMAVPTVLIFFLTQRTIFRGIRD